MHGKHQLILLLVGTLLLASPVRSQDDVSRETEKKSAELPEYVRQAERAQDELSGIVSDLIPSFVFIGGGSGVLIDEKGHFLTNYHVLAQKLKQERKEGKTTVDRVFNVELVGGESRKAFIVGMDPLGDLALCRVVNGDGNFPHIELGNSDRVSIGQYVIAIGNPFLGGQFTARPIVTFGIVSGKHVFKRRYPDAIQTDAAINPGNSGGPLIGLNKKLIGINGRIETKFGTRANSGVGFALSSNRIKRFLPVLKKGGIAFHGNSELIEQTRTDEGLEPTYLEPKNGGLVFRKDPDKKSNAYRAGLRKGDELITLGGYAVNSFARLVGIIRSVPAPNSLELTYRRDGKEHTTKLKLSQYGDWTKKNLLKTLPVSEDAPYLGIAVSESDEKLKITKVAEDSPAAKAGLKKGDLVQKVNGRDTPNIAAVKRMIQSRWYGETLTLTVKRDGKTHKVKATMGRRAKKEKDEEKEKAED